MSLTLVPTQYAGHPNAKYQACNASSLNGTPLKSTQTTLGEQEIEAIITVLPETQKLDEVLDQFYYKLHDDKKLPQFSTFFSKILEDNPAVFKDLTLSQKAQILFDQYRELTFAELLKTPDYRGAYQSLYQKVGKLIESSSLTDKIYKNYLSRIHCLHSDFIAFAVADSLQSKPSLVNFSLAYQPRHLDLAHAPISYLQA